MLGFQIQNVNTYPDKVGSVEHQELGIVRIAVLVDVVGKVELEDLTPKFLLD